MKSYEKDFPLAKTKTKGVSRKFDLSDPKERKKYFQAKAELEIKLLKKYFKNKTFIAYFLGKKSAGKGTYTKLLMEIFGEDKIGHVSVGDLVRAAYEDMNDKKKRKKLMDYLSKNYRGYISIDNAINSLIGRDTKSLLPTEFILTLIKKEIDKVGKRTLFIDGFPRDMDQVSYSLFFRDLINYREDTDIFVAIDIPESVIDERMKNRVVCPKCHTPRSLGLFPTKKIGYDEIKKEFYLICDNHNCNGARMIEKEGDKLGVEAIRERLNLDGKLIEKVFSLHGIPKILIRNAMPANIASQYVDDYEITPEFSYKIDSKTKKIKIIEKPWIVKDDYGKKVHSLLAPAVVLSLIRQLPKTLFLK